MERICNKCGRTGEEYFPSRRSVCKNCLSKAQRDYRSRQSGRPAWKKTGRKYALKKRYGISPEQYEKMREDQNGLCAICLADPELRIDTHATHRMLHVDHDHKTGKVRGLLCNGCNRAIGLIQDNPITALNISLYLKGEL
jgi:hypothetical protein